MNIYPKHLSSSTPQDVLSPKAKQFMQPEAMNLLEN